MNRSVMTNGHGEMPSQLASASNGDSEDSFAKGAIVRIHLKDFMTYNEVTFNPGPNLNLILGPNGTGKSTIVSAICLGMNGKPSTLARATTLGAFVRHGANKATIEIELHNPDGPNYKITREITAIDNKSNWKYQGNPVTKQKIEEVIRSLCIQVDNLCQFLPQEQVQNFSRLNDKQLLVSTMNAVGKPELEEHFKSLKTLQVQFADVANSQEKDQEEVRRLRELNARYEGEVASFRERETLKANVKTLEKKKAWMVYQEENKRYQEANKTATELKEAYESAAASFQPLEQKIARQERAVSKTQEGQRAKRDTYVKAMSNVNQKAFAVDGYKQKMEAEFTELNAKRTSERKRMETVHATQQSIQSHEKELEELEQKEREIGREMYDVERQLQEQEPQMTEVVKVKHMAKERWQQLGYELREQQSKLRNVEDLDKARLDKLRSEKPDVFKAIMWLRENKGRFRAPIHEPPVLSFNIRGQNMAKYVENSIGGQDIIAFFCEDKQDMNELLRTLRKEMNWQVNAVHAPPNPHGEPTTVEFQPNISMSELRQYGFNSFVRDLVSGPEPVVRYFCKNNRIFNIPVGDDRVYQNFGSIRDRIGNQCPVFFGGNKRIEVSRSRYRSEAITQTSEMRPSSLLGQSVNAEVLQQLQATVAECERKVAEAKEALDRIHQDEIALNRAREALMQRKNVCHKVGQDKRNLTARLEQKKKQLQNLEREAVDLTVEERKAKEKCGVVVRNMTKALKEHAAQVETLLALDREKEALQVYLDVLRSSISANRERLAADKEQVKQLENEKDAAVREANAAKQVAIQALEEARRVSGVRKYDLLPEEILRQFTSLPETVAELEDAVHSANARIQLMGRADERVVREYEENEARINRLVKDINQITNRASSLKNEIEKVKNEFLPPLLDLISRINNSFGRYYASMRCAGEVVLYTGEGENQDDFENYGIKIRVKYRSSEPLIDLSANHHSGGERAVATALYMLAMQELTQVPFRCVDEINQGMDPFNERRVFDLLVQTACRESSAQYFLLTPKLLPGLNYSPNMRIHFVQNGEHVCDDWKVNRHLQIIRSLRNRS